MVDFNSVKGKVAVVTGGASGIGFGIVKIFAEHGMKVVIADFQDARGEEAAKEIRANGGEAIFCHADVSDKENMKNVFEVVKETYGKLNVIVNNAAVGSMMHPVHEFSAEDYEKVTSINYWGTFYGMKYGIETMLDTMSKECTVINISSANGMVPCANYSLYSSTKAAVISLTRAASLDYAKHDITCNSISPGIVFTDIYKNLAPEQLETSKSASPMGRFAETEEIAYLALFLASSMARYITGAVIPVDGGMSAGNMTEIPWKNEDPRI